MALKALGRLDEAVAAYHRALALAPDNATAHNNLGLALQAQGQLADALESYDRAIALKPDYAHCQSNRADVLIELGQLPCCYERPPVPDSIAGRQEFGLPARGTLYGCPQSLFKFHPDFDRLLAGIAEGDPDGHIVVLEGFDPTWREMLRHRWAQRHPSLVGRVKFLPRLPADRFLDLMAHFDVLLDPVHFGSGNTLYEAMLFGTPIVTWPGRFMRGRVVAAAYRQMGLADAPIAETLEDYAPLAVTLGRNPGRREALRRDSQAAAGALLANTEAVAEFECFVEAALDAAGRGERIASGWHPAPRLRMA
jgi:predicted O-linked N-acetylglucosamine transferase (SPINDLY family)